LVRFIDEGYLPVESGVRDPLDTVVAQNNGLFTLIDGVEGTAYDNEKEERATARRGFPTRRGGFEVARRFEVSIA
jgi:hypothetical protein